MIIEFDGYRINEYVIGRNCSINELITMYLNVRNEEISNEDLLRLFCVRYYYKKNPKLLQEDVTSNVVIDLDTDYIYIPNR
ncbi:TPA: hypothetical protein QC445_005239 [Bacillus cereus]|uniref:Uncharacterized protein n=2 Tax=Bacillus cereus group TaxID=86661 RepID=A0A9X6TKZ1_BACTU|nr:MULTISPECIES: hypothetical protein [Bacillus]ACK92980.1 hypothetical protein BCG9842_B2766 [Bacillus cereus G9842]AQY39058.1 hypothetical protein B4918_14215 [Bacillus thuringiensis]KAA6469303.1 hypothetical protein DX930_09105 [Bacillus cereus]KAA6479033.1 hypothetical protein DX931_11910 [Bacillus cereus]KAB2393631.1 ribbon-helix-helix domain-containing protein [Bacillus cereus]